MAALGASRTGHGCDELLSLKRCRTEDLVRICSSFSGVEAAKESSGDQKNTMGYWRDGAKNTADGAGMGDLPEVARRLVAAHPSSGQAFAAVGCCSAQGFGSSWLQRRGVMGYVFGLRRSREARAQAMGR